MKRKGGTKREKEDRVLANRGGEEPMLEGY